MTNKSLIIIPCSKKKRPGGINGLGWRSDNSVVRKLSLESANQLLNSRRLLSKQFGYAESRDLGGYQDATNQLMLSYNRYDGNLYRKIDESLWLRLAKSDHVEGLIISALYGILTPFEPICNYNLRMNESMGHRLRLSRWWANKGLGSLLKEYIKINEISFVHDFLGGLYSRISEPLKSLEPLVILHHYTYPGLGSGADHHRGKDVKNLLNQILGDCHPS
jgi:cytoplasmic iron level regulating protein YaaA (DUF328/UPF0246 family)